MAHFLQTLQMNVWYVLEASLIGGVCLWIFGQINHDTDKSALSQRMLMYCVYAFVGAVTILIILRFF